MQNNSYSNLQCPECSIIGDFIKDENEEVYCIHCGLVIESAYPYTAGRRFKTLDEILQDEENKRGEKNARVKKF